jgi:hypothetical protein
VIMDYHSQQWTSNGMCKHLIKLINDLIRGIGQKENLLIKVCLDNIFKTSLIKLLTSWLLKKPVAFNQLFKELNSCKFVALITIHMHSLVV